MGAGFIPLALTLAFVGCRAGDECRFWHPREPERSTTHTAPSESAPVPASTDPAEHNGPDVALLSSSRAVARPTPRAQTENPRAFQIGQIQRRYRAETSERDGTTSLAFNMTPSDPDFPYEIDELACSLDVPVSHPSAGRPTLRVRNKDIPRGFQINIERGFDSIAAEAPNATLLGLMNRLDKQLEVILSGKMADTVKISANKGTAPASVNLNEKHQRQPHEATQPSQTSKETISDRQRDEARKKRQSDTRQLEARFGRLQSFARSADGLVYTLPLDSPKRDTWPKPLQQLRSANITMPELYPIEPAQLRLDSDAAEARVVEAAFRRRSIQERNATMTQQINYLGQNLKDMSSVTSSSEVKPKTLATEQCQEQSEPSPVPSALLPDPGFGENDRSHVQYIPRPPEWDVIAASESSGDDSSSEESEYDEEDEVDATEAADPTQSGTSAPAEKGVLISFPHLELHGIELLELISLNVTVKCERCKDIMDVAKLRSSEENSTMREVSCKKCAAGMAVRFRRDLIHANSVRAGYLDLDGCTVVDMLLSNFVPTCSECSTSYPAPGIAAVRGDASMAICRECHHKMTFRIQEVKFLQISASAIRASRAPGRKKPNEKLGITAGTALPRQGRCSHYRKSYRWFRFSCCSKVFACDRCHDESSDHPNEHANRMICGYCSREQNYRPEDCGVCHATLTGKQGRGFWEGGRGTRDPMRMSRKDPRKYKRRPGTKPKS